jgi:hypothetical protein
VQIKEESDLDRTFSHDGRTTANFGQGPVAVARQTDRKTVVVGNILAAVAIQKDSKIVVGGTTV